MATYYVLTTGSNSNNGLSTSAAGATVEYALDNAPSGSTIQIGAGTGDVYRNIDDAYEVNGLDDRGKALTILGSGANTILVASAAAHSYTGRDFGCIALRNNNSIVRNLVFQFNPGSRSDYQNAVAHVSYQTPCVGQVQNCVIYNQCTASPTMTYCNDATSTVVFTNCIFYSQRNWATSYTGGGATIVNGAFNYAYAAEGTRTTCINNLTFNTTTGEITSATNLGKNVGTGTDPDGTTADVGVFGGQYSWISGYVTIALLQTIDTHPDRTAELNFLLQDFDIIKRVSETQLLLRHKTNQYYYSFNITTQRFFDFQTTILTEDLGTDYGFSLSYFEIPLIYQPFLMTSFVTTHLIAQQSEIIRSKFLVDNCCFTYKHLGNFSNIDIYRNCQINNTLISTPVGLQFANDISPPHSSSYVETHTNFLSSIVEAIQLYENFIDGNMGGCEYQISIGDGRGYVYNTTSQLGEITTTLTKRNNITEINQGLHKLHLQKNLKQIHIRVFPQVADSTSYFGLHSLILGYR